MKFRIIFCNVAIKLAVQVSATQFAKVISVLCNVMEAYTSLMLSNLPSASINELKHANHEPIVRYAFVTRSLIRDNLQN